MIVVNGVYAQGQFGNISVSHGQEIEEDSEKIVKIAGEFNGKIYTLATKKKKFFIKVFTSDKMTLISTNEIVLPELKGKDLSFEGFFSLNEQLYVLGSVFDRKSKTANLTAVTIKENGELGKDAIKLFTTSVENGKSRGNFYYKKGPGGNSLLVLHAAYVQKLDLVKYEVKLFDNKLNTLMSNLQKVPFKDRKGLEFDIADFDVNANDDVFIVVNESYRNKKTKTNHEKFQVHAYKKANRYKKEVINIKFKNSEVMNCEMMATSDGKLNLVGFYSDVRKNGKPNKDLKGVYACSIDVATNTNEGVVLNEFDLDTKIKLLGERKAEKGKDVKPMYKTHSLIEKQDGGVILLSEFQVVQEGKSSGIGPISMTPVTFTNNEIIVTSLKPDGSLDWANVVPKKQQASYTHLGLSLTLSASSGSFSVSGGVNIHLTSLGKGPEYLSAIPVYDNGRLIVIFNDNPKNHGKIDLSDVKWMRSYNNSLPSALIFEEDGTMSRFDQADENAKILIMRPRVFLRLSPTEYIIYSSRKSKDKLGRLSVGEIKA
ncbi:MAG: hypothetical protein BM564_08330 [Bacteroidetes bacterium MedPE-SWsnd-G2]|nr:MAG: hypothetical protein BM564_08330 [Bacteroidetes bacterium MedPE-SWsnd-G2]